jgi:predicted phage baseplate assembly protein
MPLPVPILDDRSYQQIRDELVRRIPVYNPEWTDHNPTDPAITLLELFAFLGENLLYRFNQIPETTRLAFLQLLQIPLRPATPARALVAFSNPKAVVGDEPLRVDLGAVAKAGDLPFEITTEVTVAPWRSIAAARSTSDPPDTIEGQDYTLAAIDAMGGLAAGQTPGYYRTTIVPDDPSKPEAAAVDFGATVDETVWLALVGAPGHLAKLAGKTLNIGCVPDEEIRSFDEALVPCPGEFDALPRRDPCRPLTADDDDDASEIVWEISTKTLNGSGEPIYRRLVIAGDTTRSLTEQGVVRLRIPEDVADLGVPAAAEPDRLGTGAWPPLLENKEDAANTVAWIRGWYRTEGRRLERMLWLGINAVEAVQQRRAAPEYLGTGNGQGGQRFRLVNRPVIADSLVLEVEELPGHWVRWTEVSSFEASREDDKHCVVDRESGVVQCGNGVRGFAPQLGQRVRATEYRYGGGEAGNVNAKAIDKLEAPGLGVLKLSNPLPARGGEDSEAIAAALERIPGELRRRDRAVTQGDFQELALATPGAEVGRAECLPRFDPRSGITTAAGVVSVVVWPKHDPRHLNAPMPDRTTLRTVCAWLDRRRLVTTELYVIPPSYVQVAVSVAIHVKPGYGVDAVRSWVELVIRQYLAPLPPYGPEGHGWPLGRRVYGPELEAAALQVEGVEYIEEQGIQVARRVGNSWQPGPVLLLPHQVPELAVITVVSGDQPLPPGQGYAPPPSTLRPIPIPVIPEEC